MDAYTTPGVPNLAIGYVFARAWGCFKENLLVAVAVFVAAEVLGNAAVIMRSSSDLRAPTQLVLGGLISPAIMVGVYHVALQMVRGREIDFFVMFDGFSTWPRALGVVWCLWLVTLAGLVLLIVPGVIWRLGLAPALFLVLDADDGVFATLGRAWRLTYGYKVKLYWISLALLGFNLVGIAALGIGVIFTGAMSYLVMAVAYEELLGGEGRGIAEQSQALAA